MEASLVMFKTDGSRRDFPLRQGALVVGRKTSCELRIPLSSVSRQHCELTIDGETVKIRDLGSSNGTFHNNVRIQEANLSAGDEVVVGPVVFRLIVDGKPEKIEPIRTIVDSDKEDANTNAGSAATISPGQSASGSGGPGGAGGQSAAQDVGKASASSTSPTVDMDDPIAALELMDKDQGSSNTDQSSIVELDLQDVAKDDEKGKS